MYKHYIDMLDCEIERLVGMEKHHGKINMSVEQRLHILFENRKHAARMMDGYNLGHHNPAYKAPPAAHMPAAPQ